MEYEQIILELMSRIQKLEQDVQELKNNTSAQVSNKNSDNKISDTERARQYILKCKNEAYEQGQSCITLCAGDIQKAIGLKNRPVIVCNAMNKCMNEGDEIVRTTPSGYSTTVTIKYYVSKNTLEGDVNMKGEITLPMVEECYKQAKRVYNNICTITSVAKIAEQKTGINYSSALRTIDSIVKLLQGKFYASIINNDGMILIFKNIEEDFGKDGIEKAVRASIEHIDYLKSKTNNNKTFMRELINDYIEKYDLYIDLI